MKAVDFASVRIHNMEFAILSQSTTTRIPYSDGHVFWTREQVAFV